MKVTMTQKELDRYLKHIDNDYQDCPVRPDTESESGYSLYLQMYHWDMMVPITIVEE